MENFNVICSRGKEKLLNEEYMNLPQHRTARRRTKDKIYACMLVIVVMSCIVSCVCAVYCFKTLSEMKEIQELSKAERKESGKSFVTATESLTQTAQGLDIDASLEDVVDLDYDLEDDDSQEEFDESDDEEFYSDDADYNGSGEEIQHSTEDLNGHERIRRADDDDCRQSCSAKKGKRLRRCLKKCRKGGQKQKSLINLPSAQFEVKFTDEQIKNTVNKGYDKNVNQDNLCADVPELDGILCLDRHFQPKTKNKPLNVFEPSTWFDEKTSPVTFRDARAISKSDGIYLVYAQAYIGGKEVSKSIRLVQKRNGTEVSTLACRTGIHPDMFDSKSGQLQTCSVLGLLNLATGDTIEVQKGGEHSQIILDKDKTYFGIVQMNTYAAPKSKSRKKKN